MKIIKQLLPDDQYYKEVTTKKIIVLHHTVSGQGVQGDINWWKQTPEKIGTHYIISREGDIVQVIEDKYWVHHLGIKQYMLNQFGSKVSNNKLNQLSIGIELDSWGGLVRKDGKWVNHNGLVIPDCDVVYYKDGYRGYFGFEKYTYEQLQALKELMIDISKRHGIPLNYFPEMFNFNEKAVKGYHGIWSHTSFRPDKSDVHPDLELIEMLKSLPK